jgi:hypothetical protein
VKATEEVMARNKRYASRREEKKDSKWVKIELRSRSIRSRDYRDKMSP